MAVKNFDLEAYDAHFPFLETLKWSTFLINTTSKVASVIHTNIQVILHLLLSIMKLWNLKNGPQNCGIKKSLESSQILHCTVNPCLWWSTLYKVQYSVYWICVYSKVVLTQWKQMGTGINFQLHAIQYQCTGLLHNLGNQCLSKLPPHLYWLKNRSLCEWKLSTKWVCCTNILWRLLAKGSFGMTKYALERFNFTYQIEHDSTKQWPFWKVSFKNTYFF